MTNNETLVGEQITFTRTELATLENALLRYKRSCYDRRRKITASVRALMIVDTERCIRKVRMLAEQFDKENAND